MSQPTSELEGPNGTATAGSLVVLWEPPNNPSGNIFTVTLGGASAIAGGAPGLDLNLDTSAPTIAPAPTGPTDTGSAELPASGGESTLESTGSSDPAPATTDGGGDTAGSEEAAPLPTEPISTGPAGFTGIAAGWALLALAGAGAIAQGLRRLGEAALVQTATVCDLEGG
jgi:hypothetical protein